MLKNAAARPPVVQNADQLITLYRTFGPIIYARCRRALTDEPMVTESTSEVFARVREVLATAEPRAAVEAISRACEHVCHEVRARALP